MAELEDCQAEAARYQLIAQLGCGGMGDVFLAVQRGLGAFKRLSVIKRLRKDIAADRECVAMFLEEARLAGRLCHPNIVHTYEAGFESGYHYIAMEYMHGVSYDDALHHIGAAKFDFAVALRILIDTLTGLEYAHNLRDFDGHPMQLVHRDMSPPNIFVTYSGEIKVLDFGIAKALGSSVQTRTGAIKGKVAYMAPEQARGKTVDARADLYSVGVMLWEAIAGRARWGELEQIAMLQKVAARDNFESPNAAARNLPARCDEICARALSYDPKDRYQTAAEFRAALESLLKDTGRVVSSREAGEYVARYAQKHTLWLEPIVQAALKSELPSQASIRPVTFEIPEATERPAQGRAETSKGNSQSAKTRRSPMSPGALQKLLPGALQKLPGVLQQVLPGALQKMPGVLHNVLSSALQKMPGVLLKVPPKWVAVLGVTALALSLGFTRLIAPASESTPTSFAGVPQAAPLQKNAHSAPPAAPMNKTPKRTVLQTPTPSAEAEPDSVPTVKLEELATESKRSKTRTIKSVRMPGKVHPAVLSRKTKHRRAASARNKQLAQTVSR